LFGQDYEIPIHIIVHFRLFPDNSLVRFKGVDSLKFNYMNSLKEANTIKYSSSKEIMNIPTNETMKLLNVVFSNGNKMFREYWDLNRKFIDNNLDSIK
jgi:autophagy-related protein 5